MSSGRTSVSFTPLPKPRKNDNQKRTFVFTLIPFLISLAQDPCSLYGGAPVRVIAIAEAGGRGGLIRDAGHCLDRAAEEAAIGGPLSEGPPSPVVLHGPEGEAGCRFGGQAAAKSLDLLGDESGGGDVRVTEVADLLQGLPGGREGVHVQGRQVDGGG